MLDWFERRGTHHSPEESTVMAEGRGCLARAEPCIVVLIRLGAVARVRRCEDTDGSSMASLWRLLRELQLQCRLSMSGVEGAAADLPADRGSLRCWCNLPYRERQVWRRDARRPQRGPRNSHSRADGRRELGGRRLHRRTCRRKTNGGARSHLHRRCRPPPRAHPPPLPPHTP